MHVAHVNALISSRGRGVINTRAANDRLACKRPAHAGMGHPLALLIGPAFVSPVRKCQSQYSVSNAKPSKSRRRSPVTSMECERVLRVIAGREHRS